MANKQKGEVSFTAEGKAYRFILSVNALCELEDAVGDGAMNIFMAQNDPSRLKIKTARAVFWAGLRDHHPDMTLEEAGRLVGVIGFQRVNELVAEAINAAFPGAQGRPLDEASPEAGTGKNS